MRMPFSPDHFFKALADPTRLRCLMLLQAEGELCVCELQHALGEAQPKISRHLAMLRKLGIVTDRREGLWIHYRIAEALPEWARTVLEQTAEGTAGQRPFEGDRRALTKMPGRPEAVCCA